MLLFLLSGGGAVLMRGVSFRPLHFIFLEKQSKHQSILLFVLFCCWCVVVSHYSFIELALLNHGRRKKVPIPQVCLVPIWWLVAHT